MRAVFATPQFRKDLKTIPANIKGQADLLLALLANNPTSPSLEIKKLRGIYPPAWRVRIGSYRLIFAFNQTSLILLRFRHRKDVYRNL